MVITPFSRECVVVTTMKKDTTDLIVLPIGWLTIGYQNGKRYTLAGGSATLSKGGFTRGR
jgi:hypothetical protein